MRHSGVIWVALNQRPSMLVAFLDHPSQSESHAGGEEAALEAKAGPGRTWRAAEERRASLGAASQRWCRPCRQNLQHQNLSAVTCALGNLQCPAEKRSNELHSPDQL